MPCKIRSNHEYFNLPNEIAFIQNTVQHIGTDIHIKREELQTIKMSDNNIIGNDSLPPAEVG